MAGTPKLVSAGTLTSPTGGTGGTVRSMCVNADGVYAVVNKVLYRSTDAGASWSSVDLTTKTGGIGFYTAFVSPAPEGGIFVRIDDTFDTGDTYLYHSSDHGATLSLRHSTTTTYNCAGTYTQHECAVIGTTIIFGGSASLGQAAALISTDNGANWSWSLIPDSDGSYARYAVANSTTFLLVSQQTATYYYSTNSGATWTEGTLPTTRGIPMRVVDDTFVYAHGNNVYRSTDGVNWTATSIPDASSSTVWETMVNVDGFTVVAKASADAIAYDADDVWDYQSILPAPWSTKVPIMAAVGTTILALTEANSSTYLLNAELVLPLDGDAEDGLGVQGVAWSNCPVGVEGSFSSSTSADGWIWPSLAEALTAGDAVSPDVLANLIGRLSAATSIQGSFTLAGNLSDAAGFEDAVLAAWQLLLAEGVATTGAAVGTVSKIAALADAMTATGQVIGNLTAYAAIVQAITMESLIRQGWAPELVDATTLTDTAASIARLLSNASDSLLTSDSGNPMLRLSVIAAESLALDDDPSALLTANADLSDGVVMYVTLRLGDTDYVGWVINTDSKAPSQYTNWAFDSFATFKGKDYAAGPNGVARIGGATDDGATIDWSLRTFLTDFGSSKLKRVPDVFIGAATDGTLVVKILTRDPATGLSYSDHYLVDRARADMGQASVGRGIKSTWWALELCNQGSADVDLNSIEFRPILLDRRV